MATNLQFIKSVSGTSVTNFDITDIFSSNYDVYQIQIIEYINDDLSDFFNMRFLDSGGTVISATEYSWANLNMRAYASFTENKSASDSAIQNIGYSQSDADSTVGNNIIIYNPFDSSSYTFCSWQTASFVAGFGGLGAKGIGVHKSAETISGVRFYFGNSANSIKANVYGVK